MADKREKQKERWIFNDGIVEQLIDLLEITKVDMKGKGLDFEGDG